MGRVLRDRHATGVTVATKTPPKPGPWPPSPYCLAHGRYPEAYLRENVEERLRSLGTERLDLLQLHTWTRAWNRDPQPLPILRKLRDEGKIRSTVAADGTTDGRSLADVALQFVLAHPAVSTVIPGIRTPDQARRNCAVSGLPPQSPSLTAALRAHAWRRSVWYGGKA